MPAKPRRARESGVATATARRSRLQRPPRFKVLLHDDDFTTMDFVVEMLERLFNHPHDAAVQIMLDVHQKGIGLAGVYPHEVAEAKAAEVIRRARAAEFPFLATIEPDQDG